MLLAILYVPFLTHLFKMGALPAADLGWCVLAGLVSVGWFEVWKALWGQPAAASRAVSRLKKNKHTNSSKSGNSEK